MSQEEQLLENWRKSIPKNSKLIYDYGINKKNVRLNITRVFHELDVGKTIFTDCSLEVDSIKAAIDRLTENKEKLL